MAKGITLDSFASAKGFPVATLAGFGVRNGQGGIVVPYYDRAGNEYIKYRIRSDAENGKGFRWSAGDAALIPYGLHRPVPYNRGFTWIVEGESDCWALWSQEMPALGLPGATNVTCLKAEHVDSCARVGVIQEPGEAGNRFPWRVAQRLYDQGFTGQVFAVSLGDDYKDPRALLVAAPDRFAEILGAAWQKRTLVPRPEIVSVAPKTSSLSLAELFDEPPEEVEWLVDGLIPCAGITLLSAKAKTGKSVLARTLALAIARGKRFLGRATQAGTVLWVALEERKEQVVADFRDLGAQRHDPIRFHFGSTPHDALTWLEAECAAHQVRCVVIDTWHKLTLIENINDYAQVNRANAPLMRLSRELGVAQIWLHHNNKGDSGNGDEVLGSSALFAAADTLLSMRRSNEGLRTLRSIQRVGVDMEDTVLSMDPTTGLITSDGSRYQAEIDALCPRVLRMLAPQPLTRDELRIAMRAKRTMVYAALNECLRRGEACVVSGSGGKGDPYYFGVFDSAKPLPGERAYSAG